MFCAGVKRVGEAAPIERDTLFEIGSITKVLTALLLADAELRGELSLQQAINDFLPEATQAPGFDGTPIRLVDLATHTSGLPSFMDAAPPFDDAWVGRYGLPEMLADVAAFKLTRPIGSAWSYSNTGYGLLGVALETATGRTYEALLRERVLDPLGMSSTAITLTPELDARAATPHGATGDVVARVDIPPMLAAGALWSSVDDLLTFLAAAGGRTKSPLKPAFDVALAFRSPHGPPPGPIETKQALGWIVFETAQGTLAAHAGGTIGMSSMAVVDLANGEAAVALGNATSSHGTFAASLLRPETPMVEPPLPEAHQPITLPPAALARFVGRYQMAPGAESVVEMDGKGLICRAPDGPRLRLTPYASTGFFNPAYGFAVAFEAPDEGPVTALTLTAFGATTSMTRI